MRRTALFLGSLAASSGATACDLVLEIDVGSLNHPTTTGGQSGAGGTSSCTPGEKRDCYTGPEGTQAKGICKSGEETCNQTGTGFGPCENETLPGVEDCGTPADEDCDGESPVCSGTVLWAARYGDVESQLAQAVCADPAGNVILTGSYQGSIDFGAGSLPTVGAPDNETFVAKLDPSGKHLWSRAFEGTMPRKTADVEATPDGSLILTGLFSGTIGFGDGKIYPTAGSSDIFLVKLNPAGEPVWARTFGGIGYQGGYAVAVDGEGAAVVTGEFAGSIDFGDGPHIAAGSTDCFVAKVNAQGAVLWSRAFGGPLMQTGHAVATDGEGNIVVGGDFSGSIDFGSGAVAAVDESDIFVMKVAPDGTTVWAKTFPGGQDQSLTSIDVDETGNVVAGGWFQDTINFGEGQLNSAGGKDAFLVRLQADGSLGWARTWGDGGGDQLVARLQIGPFDNVVVAGTFSGSLDLGSGAPLQSGGVFDMFAAKLSPEGTVLWNKRFGDANEQALAGAAVAPDGSTLLAGFLRGTVDVGNQTLTSAGAEDVVVIKLAP